MKIMLVNTYYYPEIVGGAEYSVKKLAEGLKSSGQDVIVLCTGDTDSREIVDGIEIIRIRTNVPRRAINLAKAPAHHKLIGRICEIWNSGNEKKIDTILDKEKPDVIHTNGLYDISPVIWKVAKKYGIRVVHTLRDYFLCCPLVAMECENNGGKCKFKTTLCPVHRKSNNRAVKKYVDVLTAPSSVTLNKVVMTMDLRSIPSIVVPNAIDFDISKVKRILEEKQAKNSSVVKFVYLGTLSEKKGVRWLLDSFEKVESNEAELYIAGKGELEDLVKDYCSKDARIHFVGFLNETEMNKLLEKMDILVCPSLWEEPFGRVVLDAYKNAMPVIASDRGALPELIVDGETGLIVSKRSREKLCTAIMNYIQNPEIIIHQRKNAVEILKKYSLESQIVDFISIYRS